MAEHNAGLSQELLEIRDLTKKFMSKEVLPAEEKAPFDAFELPDDVLLALQKKAKSIGLWSVRAPQEYGGGGLSLLASTVIAEETAKCKMGAYVPACGATGSNPPAPILLGTKEGFCCDQ